MGRSQERQAVAREEGQLGLLTRAPGRRAQDWLCWRALGGEGKRLQAWDEQALAWCFARALVVWLWARLGAAGRGLDRGFARHPVLPVCLRW